MVTNSGFINMPFLSCRQRSAPPPPQRSRQKKVTVAESISFQF
jgi:hypothetical protein